MRCFDDLFFLALDRYRFGVKNPRLEAVLNFLGERAQALVAGEPVVRFWNDLKRVWEDTPQDLEVSKPFEDAVDATEAKTRTQLKRERDAAKSKLKSKARTPLLPKHFWRTPLQDWSIVPLNLPAGVRAISTGLVLRSRQYEDVPGFAQVEEAFARTFT